MSNREAWLHEAANLIYTDIIAPVAVIPEGQKFAVSCGWPSRGALSASRRRVGECWAAEVCSDGITRQVFISPVLHEAVDGYGDGVLPTLAHELVHVVSTERGHRGEFRRIALAIGLEGKMTASVAGNELCQKLNAIAGQLGEYPHAPLNPADRARTQSTRMIKVRCPKCGYTARVTRLWLTVGPLSCPDGDQLVEA